ncbi:DNA-directed RNA polymerase I subunit RPA1 [Trichinella nelsoni]|uniref:DNA-directed RNA polymerase subunit n=1 Tax=Trichinella nelsoni TaxID=6336 RepID=A0A0V0SJV9_9BILA|nr:DNA-directed RNA polymerase I subunit RPA1 [Trichinella nelsoni]
MFIMVQQFYGDTMLSQKLKCQADCNTLNSAGFDILTPEEVLEISVKEITVPNAFDALYHPIAGGLCDPAFGPVDYMEYCATCSFTGAQCPGHYGHIRLPLPMFNPLLFDITYQLIRGTCFVCHRLFVADNEVALKIFFAQMEALDEGNLALASEIADISTEVFSELCVSDSPNLKNLNNSENSVKKNMLKERLEELKKNRKTNSKGNLEITKNVSQVRRELISEFCTNFLYRRIKQCPSCTSQVTGIRNIGKRAVILTLPSKKGMLKNKSNDSLKNNNKYAHGNQRYVSAAEVCSHLQMVWKNGGENILSSVFPMFKPRKNVQYADGFIPTDLLFLTNLLVMPPKFRPIVELAGRKYDNPISQIYRNIIEDCLSIKRFMQKATADKWQTEGSESVDAVQDSEEQIQTLCLSMQSRVNELYDNSETSRIASGLTVQLNAKGLRQVLEKKDGLFRKHMMGKRVNFAARSVIAPDPYMSVDGVGIPEVFAKRLSFPEAVFSANATAMSEAVLHGPDVHPGANFIIDERGMKIYLNAGKEIERSGMAKRLLQTTQRFGIAYPKKVCRHLKENDFVLLNRQPTLHKPSIMAHKVKVLKNQRTLRLNYATCKTYNADFDGDEMNAHFPQNEIARAECSEIADVARQFLVPKDGKPIAGLIQDHVVSGFMLTMRDKFLTKEDFNYLLLSAFPSVEHPWRQVPPTIFKPVRRWTGKQVVTTILLNVIPSHLPPINLVTKAKTSVKNWTVPGKRNPIFELSESNVVICSGELLCGVLDKAQMGASPYGLVHCIFELYGPAVAAKLLSCFSRLFTTYLQMRGFTLGVEDIMLTEKADSKRRKLLSTVDRCGSEAVREALALDVGIEDDEVKLILEKMHFKNEKESLLRVEQCFRQATDKFNDQANKVCFPNGLLKAFPDNGLSLMIETGAKGTSVNFFQMSCMLGQVDLEGQRVKVGMSGRTLPCFQRYDTKPRAGGFVSQRFLSGVRPQEFFFHCLAGREGLIDTAVKTSRSGYLQRCIIKHMEGIVANYDLTVRDADGSIIQFYYGEDGFDVTKSQFYDDTHLAFLHANIDVLEQTSGDLPNFENEDNLIAAKRFSKIKRWKEKYGKCPEVESMHKSQLALLPNVDEDSSNVDKEQLVAAWFEYPVEKRRRWLRQSVKWRPDPVMSTLRPTTCIGALSDKFLEQLDNFIQQRQARVDESVHKFEKLMKLRGMRSLVEPGETVGLLAAQSIGEPSTQMTLNTFHFAGCGEMNVTLGIPRLREILISGSATISTPTSRVQFRHGVSRELAEDVQRRMNRIVLNQVLEFANQMEFVTTDGYCSYCCILRTGWYSRLLIDANFFHRAKYREYEITLKLSKRRKRPYSLRHLDSRTVMAKIEQGFFRSLCFSLKKMFHAGNKFREVEMFHIENENEINENEDGLTFAGGNDQDSSEEEDDNDVDAVEAQQRQRHKDDNEYLGEDEEAIELNLFTSGENCLFDSTGNEGESVVQQNSSNSEEIRPGKDDDDDEHLLLDQYRVKMVVEQDSLITDYRYDSKRNHWCKATVKVCSMCDDGSIQVWGDRHASVRDIKRCMLTEQNGELFLITEGINLKVLDGEVFIGFFKPMLFVFTERPDIFNVDRIYCNNIHTMASMYGIEAAAQSIIRETKNVFASYGIEVDHRHLSLLSDYMTHTGKYYSFSRNYMNSSTSPFQKMSFETTVNYMKEALTRRTLDTMQTPSANLVVGRLPRLGTGFFDVLAPLPNRNVEAEVEHSHAICEVFIYNELTD